VNLGISALTVKVSRTEWYHFTPGKYHNNGQWADSWFMSMSIATLTWIAPTTANTGGITSKNRSMRTAEVGASHLRKLCPRTNAGIARSNGKEDKRTARVRAAHSSKLRPIKAKPDTQTNMLKRGQGLQLCRLASSKSSILCNQRGHPTTSETIFYKEKDKGKYIHIPKY
jgi:hypothetical protein